MSALQTTGHLGRKFFWVGLACRHCQSDQDVPLLPLLIVSELIRGHLWYLVKH